MKKKPEDTSDRGVRFVAEYTNRWGKRMVAADYGYKGWPFPFRRRTT